MHILNLHNFGRFEVYGQGHLKPLFNDGRYEFVAPHDFDWDYALCNSRSPIIEGYCDEGWLLRVFAIRHIDNSAGSDYGWYTGNDLASALEEYFRMLSENGYILINEDDLED